MSVRHNAKKLSAANKQTKTKTNIQKYKKKIRIWTSFNETTHVDAYTHGGQIIKTNRRDNQSAKQNKQMTHSRMWLLRPFARSSFVADKVVCAVSLSVCGLCIYAFYLHPQCVNMHYLPIEKIQRLTMRLLDGRVQPFDISQM